MNVFRGIEKREKMGKLSVWEKGKIIEKSQI
jgi:hypothetical protein